MFFLILGGIAYGGYQLFKTTVKFMSDPHNVMIYNGTIHPGLGASVVHPLIGHDTKFDIVATVLLRDPNSITRPQQEEDIARRNEERRTRLGWDEADIQRLEMQEELTAKFSKINVTDVRSWASEKVLWSGYLAKGRTMGDKALDTSITFDMPLERL
jgi:hypothetical protein